jgi:ubiquinol-cytochrome c reductase cytochrome b subunit
MLDEPVPGGASWAYVFGSTALILFGVQLLTGLVLAAYYGASATDAWASVAYLEREITLGALVRGIHHHAASAMVAVVGFHFLQVALFGAYKAPREANWLSGLFLLGLVLAFALTGYLLPWDQTGYWATKVATSIAGTVPIVGGFVQRVVQGGNDYGSLTLTRFYALHVIALPLLTCGLIGAHLALFRKHGVTVRPGLSPEREKAKVDPFWPHQVAIDAAFALFVVLIVVGLAAVLGAPLQAPADPSSDFIARPEWYFLFLFQLLKYFDGPLQVVGTVLIPGAVTLFLVSLPFLDRGRSRHPRDRLRWMVILLAGVAGVIGLTILAVRSDSTDSQIAVQRRVAEREAKRARLLAMRGVGVAGASQMMADDPLTRGERIFRRECMACHPFEGERPKVIKAPDLTGYRSRAWIRQVLRDPDSPRLFGRTEVQGMKSWAHLDEGELELLVDLVHSRRSPTAPPVAETPAARLVRKKRCDICHDFEETYALEGPALFSYGSRAWVTQVISDPGADHFYGKANTMPAFSERLSERDLESVVEFLLSLEARAAPDQWPKVDDPGPVPTPRPTNTSTKS